MTVEQLHTGTSVPLSNTEWVHWNIYSGREAQRKQLEASKLKNQVRGA